MLTRTELRHTLFAAILGALAILMADWGYRFLAVGLAVLSIYWVSRPDPQEAEKIRRNKEDYYGYPRDEVDPYD